MIPWVPTPAFIGENIPVEVTALDETPATTLQTPPAATVVNCWPPKFSQNGVVRLILGSSGPSIVMEALSLAVQLLGGPEACV